jgi:dTDP-4-dehydrorhamnose reductase
MGYSIFKLSETTWFEFAKKIAEFSKSSIKLNPLTTEQYPTPAKKTCQKYDVS